MSNKKFYTSILLTSALSLTSFAGCGNTGKDDAKMGGFELRLTDAPIDDVESVLVTFDEVAVRRCVTEAENEAAGGDKEDADKEDDKEGDKDEDKEDDKEGDKDEENDDESDDEKKSRQNDDETTTGMEEDSTSEGDSTDASTGDSDDETTTDDKTDDKTGDDTKEDDDDEDDKDDEPVADAPEEAETESPDCVKQEWVVLSTEEMSFDLLKLQDGKTKRMVAKDIEAGTYNELRLKLTKAEIVVDGETVELDVPSGSSSGLKVKAVFVIDADSDSSMTVDFDAGKSLTRTGDDKWKLQPVLKAFKPTKTKKESEDDDSSSKDDTGEETDKTDEEKDDDKE